jgi:hypothetical protein
MIGRGVSAEDMTIIPRPRRAAAEAPQPATGSGRHNPLLEDHLVGPSDASDPGRLAALVRALGAPAQPPEWAGQDATGTRPRRHRAAAMAASLALGRLALTGGVAVAAVGGLAAAGYAGALPTALQGWAHRTIGAPPPVHAATGAEQLVTAGPSGTASAPASTHPRSSPAASAEPGDSGRPTAAPSGSPPVGPDAAGPAGFGLCTAYLHGGLRPGSVAYRNLAVAAGGPADLAGYCATRSAATHPQPSATTGPSDQPGDQPGGPSGVGAAHAATHPGAAAAQRPGHRTGGSGRG